MSRLPEQDRVGGTRGARDRLLMLIVAFFWLAVSIPITFWLLPSSIQFLENSRTVVGEVITVPQEFCDGSAGCRHYSVVRYTTIDGVTYETSMKVDRDARPGTEVEVRYLSDDPTDTMESGPQSAATLVFAILAGPVLMVACIGHLAWRVRDRVQRRSYEHRLGGPSS